MPWFKWIDMPPVWLVSFIVLAKLQSEHLPYGLSFGGPWADLAAGLLIGGGLILLALAMIEMRKQRTTVIPHNEAAKLVTGGIFRRSRNPIYLGDVLILAGFILRFDAVLSLPLLPLFVWIIERRFIVPEENGLRRKFRADFARYCQKTRRWV